MSTTTPAETTSYATVAVKRICIAPENVRAHLPPDEGIPQLWQTIKAARLLYPLITRPGKKTEADFATLDGRRRYYAFLHGVAIGDITEDEPVNIQIETDKNRQLAALLLTASESEPTHLVDIIRTIRHLRERKLKPGAIAEALGYPKIQIDRWGALSTLSDDTLEALRAGKLTFRQATLLTKIPDAETQAALVEQARNGSLYDQSISMMIVGKRITAADPRVRLVGLGRYTAAGGRVESDLFNETPDILLDPDKLQTAWTDCARPLCTGMKDAGLAVFVSFDRQYQAPDGFRSLPISIYGGTEDTDQREAALRALGESQNALRDIEEFDDSTNEILQSFVERSHAHAQAREPTAHIGAVIVTPDKDFGIGLTYFATVEPEVEVTTDAADAGKIALANDGATAPRIHGGATRERYEKTPEAIVTEAAVKLVQTTTQPPVAIEARTNGLHERYTDLATRGLIRALSEDPTAALDLLLARLFVKLVVQPYSHQQESATTIAASPFSRSGMDPHPALDGEVRAKLDEHRDAFIAAGVRPIAWVGSLAHGQKMTMLAELTALSLDLVESNTKMPRNAARADAAEIAEILDYDFTNYATPDEAFFSAHGKTELLKMLEKFDPAATAEASSLRKDDLAVFVAERAAEHRWAPDALSWRQASIAAGVSAEGGELTERDATPPDPNTDSEEPDRAPDLDAPAEVEAALAA